VPVLVWLARLRRENERAFAKCVVRIERLEAKGYELRRPEADTLRDGIYELRARQGTVQYGILYSFHGRNVAVLTHALTKEGKVPKADIQRAIRRKHLFEKDPKAHTHSERSDDHER
jgi:hypothetical protein